MGRGVVIVFCFLFLLFFVLCFSCLNLVVLSLLVLCVLAFAFGFIASPRASTALSKRAVAVCGCRVVSMLMWSVRRPRVGRVLVDVCVAEVITPRTYCYTARDVYVVLLQGLVW